MWGRCLKRRYTNILRDPVYGDIPLDRSKSMMLNTPELRRLHYIRALGLAYLIYPSATHSMFGHSVGVSFLADSLAEQLGASSEDRLYVSVAGLLHDVDHMPFSHTTEEVVEKYTRKDHASRLASILDGRYETRRRHRLKIRSLSEVLEAQNLDKKRISGLILGRKEGKQWLSEIISGPFDADRMDYLQRDAYHVGISRRLDIGTMSRSLSRAWVSEREVLVWKKERISSLLDLLVQREEIL